MWKKPRVKFSIDCIVASKISEISRFSKTLKKLVVQSFGCLFVQKCHKPARMLYLVWARLQEVGAWYTNNMKWDCHSCHARSVVAGPSSYQWSSSITAGCSSTPETSMQNWAQEGCDTWKQFACHSEGPHKGGLSHMNVKQVLSHKECWSVTESCR